MWGPDPLDVIIRPCHQGGHAAGSSPPRPARLVVADDARGCPDDLREVGDRAAVGRPAVLGAQDPHDGDVDVVEAAGRSYDGRHLHPPRRVHLEGRELTENIAVRPTQDEPDGAAVQLTPSRSTTKMSVSLGLITPPAPRAP